jgi:hypothetical protein
MYKEYLPTLTYLEEMDTFQVYIYFQWNHSSIQLICGMNSRIGEHVRATIKESRACPKCTEVKLSHMFPQYDCISWKQMLWNYDSIKSTLGGFS